MHEDHLGYYADDDEEIEDEDEIESDDDDASDEIADALREMLSGGGGKPAIMIITPGGWDAPRGLPNLTPVPGDLDLDAIFGDDEEDDEL